VITRQLDDLSSGSSMLSAQDIRQKVQKILEGVRHFSQELRPSILDDLGLVSAVKWLASDLKKNYNVAVETEIVGNQSQLPPEVELMLFRITQEALTNVRKHSEATQVFIKLDFSEHKVKVLIHDNGIGFEMPTRMGDFTIVDKLGLVGMQERVQLLGGIMSIESQPSKGTSLTVEVPIM
jgi:two-component system sensor histidine kinase DegS